MHKHNEPTCIISRGYIQVEKYTRSTNSVISNAPFSHDHVLVLLYMFKKTLIFLQNIVDLNMTYLSLLLDPPLKLTCSMGPTFYYDLGSNIFRITT